MSLRAIEIFVAVVEDGSLTVAARRLGLSQSAVSQAISSLEETLGKPLLDRTVRPPCATLVGKDFFRKAVALLDRARDLEQVTDLDQELPSIRIGMPDSFTSTAGPFLTAGLKGLAAQWMVLSSLSDIGVRALAERRVDFLFTSEEPRTDSEFLWLPILEEPFLAIAPREIGVERMTVRQLVADVDFVRYSQGSFLGRKIDGYFQMHALRPRERYYLDTTDAALAMVCAGLGWTISTPLCLLKTRQKAESFVFVPLRPAVTRRLYLVSRKAEAGMLAEKLALAAKEAVRTHCIPALSPASPRLSIDVL